jgi:hypothetical protein
MTKTTDQILDRLRIERDELFAAAEKLLEAMARDPHSVDVEDKFVFQVLGWDEEQVRRELSRVHSVLKWRPMAGSSKEFAEAIETHHALQQSVPEECEKIEAQIKKLSEKLATEQRKLTDAEKRVQRMETSRRNLRDMIPSRVKKMFDSRMVQIRSSRSAARMRELASRHRVITDVLQNLSEVTSKNYRSIIYHVEGAKVEGVLPPPTALGSSRTIDEAAWSRYLNQLRNELPAVESELRELTAEYEDELASAETILDYYLQDQK